MPFTIPCQTDYIYLNCASSQRSGKWCMACTREILGLYQFLNCSGFNISQKVYKKQWVFLVNFLITFLTIDLSDHKQFLELFWGLIAQ